MDFIQNKIDFGSQNLIKTILRLTAKKLRMTAKLIISLWINFDVIIKLRCVIMVRNFYLTKPLIGISGLFLNPTRGVHL